jgi:hypothetical protein
MKSIKLAYLIRNRDKTLAIFGAARLIKTGAGPITLVGGTLDDRRAAREWCALFCHSAAFDVKLRHSSPRDYLRLGCGNRNLPKAKALQGRATGRSRVKCSLFLHEAVLDVTPQPSAIRSSRFALRSPRFAPTPNSLAA